MIIGILTKKKFWTDKGKLSRETYCDYREIEIESFKWLKNHQLEYVPKGYARYFKLEKNEELIKMI